MSVWNPETNRLDVEWRANTIITVVVVLKNSERNVKFTSDGLRAVSRFHGISLPAVFSFASKANVLQ